MQTVNRLPRYLCTETVDRSTSVPKADVAKRSCDEVANWSKKANWKTQELSSDRLRLDVAISGGAEMYSWVAEDRFGDSSLADLVKGGATSTGMFALFLESIFGSNAATFTYLQNTSADGRELVEFGFRAALDKSKYRMGNSSHQAIVAYNGTFLADPKSFDLVQLTIHAAQLPEELHLCESTTTLDYGSARLNNSQFLIPKDARWHVINPDGMELDYRTVFTGCREFHGESTLRFDASDETAPGDAPKSSVPDLQFPSGLSFSLVLAKPIEIAVAAAGDSFEATLSSVLRGTHREILVPKGAAITGRIIRVERLYGPDSQLLTLALKLETIEVNGRRQHFHAKLESVVRMFRRTLNPFETQDYLIAHNRMFDLKDPDVGFLKFEDVSKTFVIDRGFPLRGRTAK